MGRAYGIVGPRSRRRLGVESGALGRSDLPQQRRSRETRSRTTLFLAPSSVAGSAGVDTEARLQRAKHRNEGEVERRSRHSRRGRATMNSVRHSRLGYQPTFVRPGHSSRIPVCVGRGWFWQRGRAIATRSAPASTHRCNTRTGPGEATSSTGGPFGGFSQELRNKAPCDIVAGEVAKGPVRHQVDRLTQVRNGLRMDFNEIGMPFRQRDS